MLVSMSDKTNCNTCIHESVCKIKEAIKNCLNNGLFDGIITDGKGNIIVGGRGNDAPVRILIECKEYRE